MYDVILCFPGQGVVMNKSVFSDFVYMEAMCNSGFVSKGGEFEQPSSVFMYFEDCYCS